MLSHWPSTVREVIPKHLYSPLKCNYLGERKQQLYSGMKQSQTMRQDRKWIKVQYQAETSKEPRQNLPTLPAPKSCIVQQTLTLEEFQCRRQINKQGFASRKHLSIFQRTAHTGQLSNCKGLVVKILCAWFYFPEERCFLSTDRQRFARGDPRQSLGR